MIVDVPAELAAAHGREWFTTLAADRLDHWELSLDGPSAHGMASLVLPVRRADGTPAVLKLQPVSDDSVAAPLGLRTWAGNGTVLLLDHDPDSGAQLLERLDAARPLSSVTDDDVAMGILAELLARLVAVPAPSGVRRLSDLATAMLDRVPGALPALRNPAERELVRTCAAAVAELTGEAGDRLLHWDLHYDNILAAHRDSRREPWLAIDPEPLAGDPGFDLWPALDTHWDRVVATGDVRRGVLRRFDLLVEVLDLDRERAIGWTLGRVLQNALWDIEDGRTALEPAQVATARALLA